MFGLFKSNFEKETDRLAKLATSDESGKISFLFLLMTSTTVRINGLIRTTAFSPMHELCFDKWVRCVEAINKELDNIEFDLRND